MAKLFEKKNPEDLRNKRVITYVNPEEYAQIRTAASIRQLDVGEFMRRAALGRRADVDYETEIVLALIDLTRSVRELRKPYLERNEVFRDDDWRPIVAGATAAMLRITQ